MFSNKFYFCIFSWNLDIFLTILTLLKFLRMLGILDSFDSFDRCICIWELPPRIHTKTGTKTNCIKDPTCAFFKQRFQGYQIWHSDRSTFRWRSWYIRRDFILFYGEVEITQQSNMFLVRISFLQNWQFPLVLSFYFKVMSCFRKIDFCWSCPSSSVPTPVSDWTQKKWLKFSRNHSIFRHEVSLTPTHVRCW